MITSNGLTKLGFISQKDFTLQDDGSGPYIKEWKSALPQPTRVEIESAHSEWEAEEDAEKSAKSERLSSAKSKLESLNFTVDEIKEAFGI